MAQEVDTAREILTQAFAATTNQYAALEVLANSDPVLVPVPVPDDSKSEYLLLQQYVLVLLYLDTNGVTWTGNNWLCSQRE